MSRGLPKDVRSHVEFDLLSAQLAALKQQEKDLMQKLLSAEIRMPGRPEVAENV